MKKTFGDEVVEKKTSLFMKGCLGITMGFYWVVQRNEKCIATLNID